MKEPKVQKNIVGDRIREARLKSKPKITQLDLIARLATRGVQLDETAISKIEAKTRPVLDYEIVAISEALGVSILWLLGKD